MVGCHVTKQLLQPQGGWVHGLELRWDLIPALVLLGLEQSLGFGSSGRSRLPAHATWAVIPETGIRNIPYGLPHSKKVQFFWCCRHYSGLLVWQLCGQGG